MSIKELLAQMAQSKTGPAIKVLEKGEQFKVILIGFKKEMALKAHQTPIKAKLIVLEGKVNYIEAQRLVVLKKYDELDIPKTVVHSVQALEDSICLLIQSQD